MGWKCGTVKGLIDVCIRASSFWALTNSHACLYLIDTVPAGHNFSRFASATACFTAFNALS